jgi:hypothetical protein
LNECGILMYTFESHHKSSHLNIYYKVVHSVHYTTIVQNSYIKQLFNIFLQRNNNIISSFDIYVGYYNNIITIDIKK